MLDIEHAGRPNNDEVLVLVRAGRCNMAAEGRSAGVVDVGPIAILSPQFPDSFRPVENVEKAKSLVSERRVVWHPGSQQGAGDAMVPARW